VSAPPDSAAALGRPLHVGLNLVFLVPGEQGGMETYARELIPQLVRAAPQWRFTSFVSREAAEAGGPWQEQTECVVVPVGSRSRVQWVRGEQQLLPPLARRAGVQLMHSFASTAPAWGSYRRVVTVHDLIYRSLPEAHPGLRSLGMRVLVPLAVRSAHRVIAPSQATADDLVALLGTPRAKVDVVHEGVGAGAARDPLPVAEVRDWLGAGERPIVLTVSAKLAHKNLRRLIDALARIPAESRPLLVLPGYATPHEQELTAHAASLDLQDDVRFLGWVTSAQLEGLYAAAAAFVLPTLAEGFGLPVLEAMARSVPVACSDIPVLREVAGDGALYFDPYAEASISDAIERLLTDRELAGRLAGAGPGHAERFSWSQAARGTLDSYARALP
jgi:glycosyltransferase involved in cell wall biosynthesis